LQIVHIDLEIKAVPCVCCKETVHFAGPEKVKGVTIDSVRKDSVRLSWNGVAGISNYSVDAQLSRTRRQIGSDPVVEVLTNIFNISGDL